ncbi:olfactory receptor 12D1-like [Pelodytes ibericus]
MGQENVTYVTSFLLLGLTDVLRLRLTLFVAFVSLYTLNLVVNHCIMVIILKNPRLYTPMYFFLWNLSFLDITYSSVVVPKMLTDLIVNQKTISFTACIMQVHFFHFLGSTEIILFAVMSYDRYLAIGYPLHYTNIMSHKVCLLLALGSWVVGFFHALLHSVMTSKIPFCGPKLVSHYFCDVKPLLKLACADTSLNLKLLNYVTGALVIITLLLTLLSYVFIGKCLIKIRTVEGRRRAFSTCSAHLTVVSLQFGTCVFIFLRPTTEDSLDQDKAVAVLFTVVTPALNPIIYTLRNQEIKKSMRRTINRLLF